MFEQVLSYINLPIQSIVRGLGPSNPKNPRLKNRGLRVGKPSDMHFFLFKSIKILFKSI